MRKLATFAYTFAFATAVYQYLLSPETILWGAVLVLVVAAAGILLADGRKRLLLMAFALAAGIVWSGAYDLFVALPLQQWAGRTVSAEAEVLDYSLPAASGGQKVLVRLSGDGMPGCKANYYGGDELKALSPGDRIGAEVYMQDAGEIRGETIRSFTAKGIHLLLYPKGEATVTPGGDPLRYLPRRIAHWLEEQIALRYDGETAPFLTAMLLGDRSDFSDTRSTQLSEVGLYHITAVSGLHCGFLLLGVGWIIGRHRRRLFAAAAIPLLLLYMVVVGCSASVVRATVIQILCLLAPLLRRPEDRLTSLGAAMLLLLLVNPMAITGIGFQLTFASMFGILCLTPAIYRGLAGKRGGRLRRAVAAALASSLGATALTAPLCAVYFNYLVLIGPVSNLLTIAVAGMTFFLGLLSLPVSALIPALAPAAVFLPEWGARWILLVAEVLSRVPYHAVYFTNSYLKYWLAFVFCLFFYATVTGRTARKYVLSSLLAAGTLAFLLWLPARSVAYGSLHAVAVDVGQGASTILSSGGQTALVDCGSSNSYLDAGDIAADTLATYDYHELDYLVLTHYHADHANGLEVLLARTRVKQLLLPAIEQEDDLHGEVADLAAWYGVEVRYITEREVLPLGEAELTLYPPLGSGDSNEEGLSVLCSSGEFDLLITGDMDGETEEKLISTYYLPDIEVLMVGHHGSHYSTSQQLLRRLRPEVGIISVGSNSYGHPADRTIQRMVRRDMTLYRTDRQGNISITVK